MGKLKKIQKEVEYMKVLIEDYQGGRKDERYQGFVQKLENYKKDLQGKVMFLSKGLRDNILKDIEYCLKTLESRVDKVSDKDILINKIKYDLNKILPCIQEFQGRRHDPDYIHYQNKLRDFDRTLRDLENVYKNSDKVKELMVKIRDCEKILECSIRRRKGMNTSKSMDDLSFDTLEGSPKSKVKSIPTKLNKVGLEFEDDIPSSLDDIELTISKIKLMYNITNSQDIDKLDDLSKQILKTYEIIENMPVSPDKHQEDRKQRLGRTLISLNKKISMDKRAAEVKTEADVTQKLEQIKKDIEKVEVLFRAQKYPETRQKAKEIKDKIKQTPRSTTQLENCKKEMQKKLDEMSEKAYKREEAKKVDDVGLSKQGLVQRALKLRAQWDELKNEITYIPKDQDEELSETIEIIRELKNDIYGQLKWLQSGRRLSRIPNVRYSNVSQEDIQQVCEKVNSQSPSPKKLEEPPAITITDSPPIISSSIENLNIADVEESLPVFKFPSVENLTKAYVQEVNKRVSWTDESLKFARTNMLDNEKENNKSSKIETTNFDEVFETVKEIQIKDEIKKPVPVYETNPFKQMSKELEKRGDKRNPFVEYLQNKDATEDKTKNLQFNEQNKLKLKKSENKIIAESVVIGKNIDQMEIEYKKTNNENNIVNINDKKQDDIDITFDSDTKKFKIDVKCEETCFDTPSPKVTKRLVKSLPPPPSLPTDFPELNLDITKLRKKSIDKEEKHLNKNRHSEYFSNHVPFYNQNKSKDFLNGMTYKEYALSIQRDKRLSENTLAYRRGIMFGSTPNIKRLSWNGNDNVCFSSNQELTGSLKPLKVKIYDNPDKMGSNLFYSFENLNKIKSNEQQAELIEVTSNKNNTITKFVLRTISSEKVIVNDEDVEDGNSVLDSNLQKSDSISALIEKEEQSVQKMPLPNPTVRYNVADFLFPKKLSGDNGTSHSTANEQNKKDIKRESTIAQARRKFLDNEVLHVDADRIVDQNNNAQQQIPARLDEDNNYDSSDDGGTSV